MKNFGKKWIISASSGIFVFVIAFFLGRYSSDFHDSNKIIGKKGETTQETTGLKKGDKVISKNTTNDSGKKGVHIRYTAEISPDNHKGWLFDGATGEIIDGPIYEDGHVWWEVSWDLGLGTSKINCGNNDSCTGWTAETINDALILNKM